MPESQFGKLPNQLYWNPTIYVLQERELRYASQGNREISRIL